jgi:hypothetical protein
MKTVKVFDNEPNFLQKIRPSKATSQKLLFHLNLNIIVRRKTIWRKNRISLNVKITDRAKEYT